MKHRYYQTLIKNKSFITGLLALITMPFIQACTGVTTFPTIARPGNTVAVMVGGTEQARKDTINVDLTHSETGGTWDLQALGKIRSVFNLRADGRAVGTHYSAYLENYISWSEGHEPTQAVLVVDIPEDIPSGDAYLTIATNVSDNSSGISDPFIVDLEIIDSTPEQRVADNFLRGLYGGAVVAPVEFGKLEPAPHAKISFEPGTFSAASLALSFDDTVINGDDINIYIPESTVRGSAGNPGAFGATQRMVYWRRSGNQLLIDIIAPQGLDSRYLLVYIIHPTDVSGPPNFTLSNTPLFYNESGTEITPLSVNLEYFD